MVGIAGLAMNMAMAASGIGDMMASAIAEQEDKMKSYVVQGAEIQCSMASFRTSNLVLAVTHGVFIHKLAMLATTDCAFEENVLTFGVCRSTENPKVQEEARKIQEEVENEKKGFLETVTGWFCKKSDDMDDSFVQQCAGPCFFSPIGIWDNGKETVKMDGLEPLLQKGTLTCKWGGVLTIVYNGQPE